MRWVVMSALLLLAMVAVGAGVAAALGIGQERRTGPPWIPPPTGTPVVIFERTLVPSTPSPNVLQIEAPIGEPELWVYFSLSMARDIAPSSNPSRDAILTNARQAGAACVIPAGETARATVLRRQDGFVEVRVESGTCARFVGWLGAP
ncbi:MAG: hypothetical protein U0556_18460 [Dehalococcoidia bacterium]